MRYWLIVLVLLGNALLIKGQVPVVNKKKIDSVKKKIDTLANAPYVNEGKIAASKAVKRSIIFPGLGQIYNYGLVVNDVKTGAVKGKKVLQKIYIVGKIAAIYGGGFVLTQSFIDNRNKYKQFLAELQYRQINKGKPNPDGGLTQYPGVDNLTTAKNIFKRNKDVVLFSLIGLYGMNVLDAYITTRLKYFNVDENIAFKISPTLINNNTMYSYNVVTPGIKLTLKL